MGKCDFQIHRRARRRRRDRRPLQLSRQQGARGQPPGPLGLVGHAGNSRQNAIARLFQDVLGQPEAIGRRQPDGNSGGVAPRDGWLTRSSSRPACRAAASREPGSSARLAAAPALSNRKCLRARHKAALSRVKLLGPGSRDAPAAHAGRDDGVGPCSPASKCHKLVVVDTPRRGDRP